MPKSVTPVSVAGDLQTYEDQHVHGVYDQIASHFSSTRYKPWPIIAKFISDLPAGWIGLDSGTGNGKYLSLPTDRPGSILTVGLDRSRNLLFIARNAGSEPSTPAVREVVLGDVLDNGWRAGVFVSGAIDPQERAKATQDYAISIATIHHLASYERRKLAVQRLFQCVSPAHGRILIYVWAIEQDELSKRVIPGSDSSGNDSANGKDVFVPWVISQQTATSSAAKLSIGDTSMNSEAIADPLIYHRYYHMFAKGELTKLTCDAAEGIGLIVGPPEEGKRGIEIVQDGWERSNYYVELRCWYA